MTNEDEPPTIVNARGQERPTRDDNGAPVSCGTGNRGTALTREALANQLNRPHGSYGTLIGGTIGVPSELRGVRSISVPFCQRRPRGIGITPSGVRTPSAAGESDQHGLPSRFLGNHG